MDKVGCKELIEEFTEYLNHNNNSAPFHKRYTASSSLSPNVSQLILLSTESGLTGDNLLISEPGGATGLNWELLTREKLVPAGATDEASTYAGATARFHRLVRHVEDTDPLRTLERIGEATAEIEQALASLCIGRAPLVPRVLRDILALPELEEVLGPDRLFFVKLLMGPPVGLNLRNVYWHGFLSPGEVPCAYASVLEALLTSLLMLASEGTTPRPKTSLSEVQPHLFDEFSFVPFGPSLTSGSMRAAVRALFQDSLFVVGGREEVMSVSVEMLLSQPHRTEAGLTLLFPQLEHCLRRAFVAANGLPYTTMSPDYRTYYTTLDIILQSNVVVKGSQLVAKSAVVGRRLAQPKYAKGPTKDPAAPEDAEEIVSDNKLVNVIGEGAVMLLNDLLIHPDGPRVRDLVSHGTLDLTKGIAPPIVRAAVSAVIALAVRMSPHKEDGHYPPWMNECEKAVNAYTSRLHPVAKSIAAISGAYQKICGSKTEIEQTFKTFGGNKEVFGEYASQRLTSSFGCSGFLATATQMYSRASRETTLTGEEPLIFPKLCVLYCTTERISVANMCANAATLSEKLVSAAAAKLSEFAGKEAAGALTKRGQKTFYKLCGCVDSFADAAQAVTLLAAALLIETDCKRGEAQCRKAYTTMKKCWETLNRSLPKLQESYLDESLSIVYKCLSQCIQGSSAREETK